MTIPKFFLQGSLSEAPLEPSLQPEAPGTASRGFFLHHNITFGAFFVHDDSLWFQGGRGRRGVGGRGARQGGGGHLAAEGQHQGNLALDLLGI